MHLKTNYFVKNILGKTFLFCFKHVKLHFMPLISTQEAFLKSMILWHQWKIFWYSMPRGTFCLIFRWFFPDSNSKYYKLPSPETNIWLKLLKHYTCVLMSITSTSEFVEDYWVDHAWLHRLCRYRQVHVLKPYLRI